jgi:nitroimidazol reductase NimA-like FMN-containing flavoprotein (pyridoxamine 5'-phosphate oxidase superfamily)
MLFLLHRPLQEARSMPPTSAPSPRARVRRAPSRADYDRATIDAILDEGLVAHLGFAVDGQPYVIPTLHARSGDVVYVHGSAASRMVRTLAAGTPACLTVTLLDGLVLARSAFHHSMNYRSVVVLGQARLVEGDAERRGALRLFTERLVPGRWDEVRPPTRQELKGTQVLALALDEASAKVRRGGPVDEDEDHALDVWAGVVPLALERGTPEPDERLRPGIAASAAVDGWAATADRRAA